MFTGITLSVTGSHIANFAKRNESDLASSLIKMATGKKINNPSDSLSDFFCSEDLQRSSNYSNALKQGINEGIAFTDVASSAGETIFTSISDMREMVTRYYRPETDDDEKVALRMEFDSLKKTVQTVKNVSRYDGQLLISTNGGVPFKKISIDARDLNKTVDIAFDAQDIADVGGLTLGTTDEATETAGVLAELGKAGSYLAKASAAFRGLNAHLNLTNNKVLTETETSRRMVEADMGSEYVQSMNRSIRNEASMSMLAQANMNRMAVIRIFN